jgi:cyanophycinase
MSRVMIRQNNPVPEMGTGLDLLPCSIIDQHYTERNRRPRLLRAVADHPGCFGLGIDESTAAVVRGRLIEVVGEGTVSVVQREVPPEARPPVPAERTFRAGEILDLVSLARGARDRARWARADSDGVVAVPQTVGVEQGSLVIVGGGRLPREVAQRFVELAGGADAKIVVLPTADVSGVEPGPREGAFLERLGAGKVTVLPGRTREKVESAESLAALEEATGIWFGGGRQWRFVDCYEGTQAVAAFHACLRRGGVIGGSSAGATIQGEYLVRGHPLGNLVMMAEGYERGFAFLPGTAVDQHVFQRMRFADMSAVVERHPQYLGIGIDEGTALIVRGETGEVWGDGYVHFYDARRAAVPGEADYLSLQAGERFDLRARRPTQ